MKRLALLKALITILFILCIITLFFAVPFILVAAVIPGQIPFDINGQPATQLGIETILVMLAVAIGFAFFTFALYLFRKLLTLFEKRKFLHDDVIKNLDQTGYAILIGYGICAVALFIYTTLVEGSMEIKFGISSVFTICLGLFFMVLSDVFAMAKKSKEEN